MGHAATHFRSNFVIVQQQNAKTHLEALAHPATCPPVGFQSGPQWHIFEFGHGRLVGPASTLVSNLVMAPCSSGSANTNFLTLVCAARTANTFAFPPPPLAPPRRHVDLCVTSSETSQVGWARRAGTDFHPESMGPTGQCAPGGEGVQNADCFARPMGRARRWPQRVQRAHGSIAPCAEQAHGLNGPQGEVACARMGPWSNDPMCPGSRRARWLSGPLGAMSSTVPWAQTSRGPTGPRGPGSQLHRVRGGALAASAKGPEGTMGPWPHGPYTSMPNATLGLGGPLAPGPGEPWIVRGVVGGCALQPGDASR